MHVWRVACYFCIQFVKGNKLTMYTVIFTNVSRDVTFQRRIHNPVKDGVFCEKPLQGSVTKAKIDIKMTILKKI